MADTKSKLKQGDLFEDSSSEEESSEQTAPVVAQAAPTHWSHHEEIKEGDETIIRAAPRPSTQIQAPVSAVDPKAAEKMKQLEGTISEYRAKMNQLEKLLKDEEEIRDDPDKKEEVEKLRDQLKEAMLIQLNELKFLQNQSVMLTKQHAGRVCETYFADERTWYAALVLEIFEDVQELEIAWIGYKKQERVGKRVVNVLTPPSASELFEGAVCNAVYTQDGMWYPCQVEKVLNEETGETELGAMLSKYLVKFKQFGSKATVPLDYIRLTKEQVAQNQRKRELMIGGGGVSVDEAGEFQIPDHLRMKRSDTEKVQLQKRKKVKALKYQYKVKKQEVESKVRQNTWLDFTNKAAGQKAGHFAVKTNMDSIFKSPDTITGKVGVVGSGKQMTSYEANKVKLAMPIVHAKPYIGGLEDANHDAKRKRYD